MSQLNSEQLLAAQSLSGAVLVLAGAGTGKTTVIVHRIANLVAAGVSLDVVAMLAGHITATGQPNIKTTVIYTTPGEQDLRFAVERLSWE